MFKQLLTSFIFLTLLLSVSGTSTLAGNAQPDLQTDKKNIYKQTNKEGVVEFTDIPNKSTKPIRVPSMNTYKQKPIQRSSTQSETLDKGYTEFAISAPLHDKAVRENSGNVSVKLTLSPKLKAGHSTSVVIDNKKSLSLSGSSLVYTFSNISRGTHSVQAFIHNRKGKVLMKSAVIEFHLLRFIAVPKPPPAK